MVAVRKGHADRTLRHRAQQRLALLRQICYWRMGTLNGGMDHHYLPCVYLNQWCGERGKLIRYRRDSNQPEKLLAEPKPPRRIYYEADLNRPPVGSSANGYIEYKLENKLAHDVDELIPDIVAAAGKHSGRLEAATSNMIRWLMQTHIARNPDKLSNIELQLKYSVDQGESEIRRLLDALTSQDNFGKHRAQSKEISRLIQQIEQLRDMRTPRATALAALASLVESPAPLPGWIEGAVHVIHAENARATLAELGLNDFPTFEKPVIEWGDNPAGLVASFSLSPNFLALVIQGDGESSEEMARRHMVAPLSHQRSAICSREATVNGPWHVKARALIPSRHAE